MPKVARPTILQIHYPFAASPNKYQTSKIPYSTSQKQKDSEGGDDQQIPHTFYTYNTTQEQQNASSEGYQ